MRAILLPFQEIMRGLERCLAPGVSGLLRSFAGLLISWWIYVPIHELLHAVGCELGGGRVWRLEIDPLYGGGLLARWLDFVVAGGEYAGRLAGFDTGGSDAVHLLTTFLPFLLTIAPGVWLMRWGGRHASGLAFGAGLVPAAGPFLSLTGDAYEIGSLLLIQLAPWSGGAARLALVGDDVTVVAGGLAGEGPSLWIGFALAWMLGVVWAFLVYAAGSAIATRLGQGPLEPVPRARPGQAAPNPSDPRARLGWALRALLATAVLALALGTYLVVASRMPGGDRAPPRSAAERTRLQASERAAPPERLRVRVLASFPHDPDSYTQGLLWEPDGFIESAGGYGKSLVRRWRPGQGRPLAEARLPDSVFAEGIAAVGGSVIQLSWREGLAFYRDRGTLEETSRVAYRGEGWGLCFDGQHLMMSDGSDRLSRRDPATLAQLGSVSVRVGAVPLSNLNELECAEGWVYANIYGTDEIARIDPATGRVSALIDASGLLTSEERGAGAEVLNGIAYNPETETFYLTGKLWPRLFEVVFAPTTPAPIRPH